MIQQKAIFYRSQTRINAGAEVYHSKPHFLYENGVQFKNIQMNKETISNRQEDVLTDDRRCKAFCRYQLMIA